MLLCFSLPGAAHAQVILTFTFDVQIRSHSGSLTHFIIHRPSCFEACGCQHYSWASPRSGRGIGRWCASKHLPGHPVCGRYRRHQQVNLHLSTFSHATHSLSLTLTDSCHLGRAHHGLQQRSIARSTALDADNHTTIRMCHVTANK